MKRTLLAATLLACGTLLAGCVSVNAHGDRHGAKSAASAKQRLVIQVSDPEPAKWNLALNNASNVMTDLGAASVEIEIITYGPGTAMIKAGSPVSSRVEEAMLKGTKVVACENSMTNQKLSKADMIPGLEYSKAGVVRIMERQREGWSYIRP